MSLYRGLLLLFTAAVCCAQSPVGAAVKVGWSGTDWFTKVTGRDSSEDRSQRWTIGPAVELRFGSRFAIEGSALYRRVQRFDSGGYSFAPFSDDERGSVWEFPLVGKVRVERKFHGLHPFGLAGPAVRRLHTRTVSNYTDITTPGPNFVQATSTSTANHVSAGVTAGGGLETRAGESGRVALEIRYSRWQSISSDCYLRCAERNQLVFLLGLGF